MRSDISRYFMAIPNFPELEEQILKDWRENDIFKQTLQKPSPKGEFVFYDGPPTANGIPHIGHVETRAFKDIIPRFKTMQGYHVERKAGWDTHGLPVEIEVEKALGLSGKKDIEQYGIEQFNAKAKESVWKYKELWERMTERIGFWLDLKHPYITYQPEYIETLWWIFRQAWDRELLTQDYKVVPYCPRCGTALSSHEVAQGYQSVAEPSVYVKFALVDEPQTYILAWTTTPWTLPGNVALAVDPKLTYAKVKHGDEVYIVADALVERVGLARQDVIATLTGKKLLGKSYTPLFDFLDLRTPPARLPDGQARPPFAKGGGTIPTPHLPRESGDKEGAGQTHAYTIVPADFVTTEDGTGVVHTAVMYGEDDFTLGKKFDLPKIHTVDLQGKFNELVKPWDGWEVKDPAEKTQRAIIQYLQDHGQLYREEKYTHDYPFCWRCKHPLLYYAKTSWFILMSKLRDQLIANNERITWHPEHIKEGRFGEWLREVKDWAISRERYWGTPLPIWVCDHCHRQECLGSYQELIDRAPTRNRYIFIRHGESTINPDHLLNSLRDRQHVAPLTKLGQQQSAAAGQQLQPAKVDLLFTSEFQRAQETADIIGRTLKIKPIEDERLNEYLMGPEFEGKTWDEFHRLWGDRMKRLDEAPSGGETWLQLRQRLFSFLHEIDTQHEGQTIVIVSHADPIYVARWALSAQPGSAIPAIEYPKNGDPIELKFPAMLFRPDGSFDPHRPFIDAVVYPCPNCGQASHPSGAMRHLPSASADAERGGVMRRVPEVADAWFDSGAMPFAQQHYPFEHRQRIEQQQAYPANFISEAVDQTRGWFYTLLAVATLLEMPTPPYQHVVVLGFLNDARGRKLSKSLKNYGDLNELFARHGADALRWFMYTTNQPWDPKNFDPKIVDEGVKKTFLILMNIVSFWQLYPPSGSAGIPPSGRGGSKEYLSAIHPLDRWALSELHALTTTVTERLEQYDITGAARAIAAFITDLSTWYVRRSRDRFKSDQAPLARATLTAILLTLSKLMAPFTPFLAEHVYRTIGGHRASVHLEDWPIAGEIDARLRADMITARRVVEQGHALRAQAGVKVRQPLAQVVTTEQLRPDLDQIVRDELNVKEVHWADHLPTGQEWLTADHVALDTTVTDELKEEGMLRDLVREVNALRKTAKLIPGDQIILHVAPQTIAAQLIERYGQRLLTDIRAKAATPVLDGATHTSDMLLDGQTVTIGLAKV